MRISAEVFGWGGNALDNRWMMLAVLTTARLVMGFQIQSIGSTAPFLVEDLGIDYTSVGLLIGLYLAPGVVLAFPAGLLGRRFGDQRVVVIGLLLMFLGGLLAGVADNYEVVVAGRFLSGIGAVLLSVLLTKMVTDWFAERELVLAIAILLNSWPIGIGLALVTLGPLAEASSWSVAFYATAAAAVIGLLLMVTLYRSPEAEEAEEAAKAGGAKITALSIREAGLVSLAGAVWALYNVAVAILPGFAPSFLIGRGASITEAGFIISLYSCLFVASVQIGGMLAQKFGRSNTIMIVGLTIFGAGFLLLPLVSSPLWVVVVIGIFGGAPAGPIVALPGQILTPKNRAPGLGLFSTWYFVVLATLLPVAGWFQDITGDAGAPLYFGGLVVLASLPFLALLRALQRHPLIAPG